MEKMFGASRKWWLVAVVALLVLVFVQPLSAGTETRPFMEQLTSAWAVPQQQQGSPTQCMVDRFNQFNGASKKSLGCTSNDVRLATISLWGGAAEACIPGTMTTVTLRRQVRRNVFDPLGRRRLHRNRRRQGQRPGRVLLPGHSRVRFDDQRRP